MSGKWYTLPIWYRKNIQRTFELQDFGQKLNANIACKIQFIKAFSKCKWIQSNY